MLSFILFFAVGAGFGFLAGAEDQIQKAERLSSEMQYEEAIKTLNDFIKTNAASSDQKTNVARAYYLLARIYFEVDEKDPQVKKNLAKVYEYDRAFTTQEINAAFKQLADRVKSEGSGIQSEEKEEESTTEPVNKTELTVKIGEGAGGSPDNGVHSFNQGKKVNYYYTAKKGVANLTVLLDGKNAPARGTVTMDKNHTLTITTTRIATVVVDSSPDEADIFVDGSASGHKTRHTFIYTTDESHSFLLRKEGYKEFKTTIDAELTQTKTINRTLEKGLLENFDPGADASILWKWLPNPGGRWLLSEEGKYTTVIQLANWVYSIYDYNFAAAKYTLTVKMKRQSGAKEKSNGIALVTGTNASAINGYLFNHTAEGKISIWNLSNYNMNTALSGRAAAIGPWGSTTAVMKGLGAYNVIKIVRDGINYSYYVNDIKMFDFKDAVHNPGYILIGGDCANQTTQLFFEYVYLDVGE